MKRTQNQRILAALRKGRVLTMLDIFKLCGSMNGHKRIAEVNAQWRQWAMSNDSPTKYEILSVPVWVKRNGRKLRAWRLA